jgi:hypothetical protein
VSSLVGPINRFVVSNPDALVIPTSGYLQLIDLEMRENVSNTLLINSPPYIALPQRRKRRGCLIYGTIVAIWQLPSLKGPLPRPVLNRGAAPSQTNNTPLSLYLQPLTAVSPPEQEAFEPTPIPTQFPSRCLPANIPNLAVE